MIKFIHVFLLLTFLNTAESGSAQRLFFRYKYDLKKMVTIPGFNDSSGTGEFCICKIVTFSYRTTQRTDAIFVTSPPDTTLSSKELVRNIDKELQQALWFFDSYKVIGRYASPASCNTLYKYLLLQHREIKRSTFIVASYAVR